MDELEISGKRYISAKRAGKENKYHPDYIGQLIRAGKVEGQKVGRSWYVVADSLSGYLAKEPQVHAPAAPTLKQAQPVFEEVQEEERQEEAPEAFEAVVEDRAPEIKKVADPREYHIPVKIAQRGGLRYLADDEPLFPAIKKTKEYPASYVQVMPREAPQLEEAYEADEVEEEEVVVRPRSKPRRAGFRAPLVRAGAVLAIGGVVFAFVALVSLHLISITKVAQGQPASVGYSLQ